MFSIEHFKIISNFGPLQRMSRMTKYVTKAGKVDLGAAGLGDRRRWQLVEISGNFGSALKRENVSSARPTGKFPEKVENLKK